MYNGPIRSTFTHVPSRKLTKVCQLGAVWSATIPPPPVTWKKFIWSRSYKVSKGGGAPTCWKTSTFSSSRCEEAKFSSISTYVAVASEKRNVFEQWRIQLRSLPRYEKYTYTSGTWLTQILNVSRHVCFRFIQLSVMISTNMRIWISEITYSALFSLTHCRYDRLYYVFTNDRVKMHNELERIWKDAVVPNWYVLERLRKIWKISVSIASSPA